ncbi:MAG: hypothetical protein ACKOX6_12035 [Bdellovibrio sp.]
MERSSGKCRASAARHPGSVAAELCSVRAIVVPAKAFFGGTSQNYAPRNIAQIKTFESLCLVVRALLRSLFHLIF